METVGTIVQWANPVDGTFLSDLPDKWWSEKYARDINGTDGALYPPFLEKSDQPYLFVSDICRHALCIYLTQFLWQNV